eukprot:197363_1
MQNTSNNSWLPMLISGFMKDAGNILKSNDSTVIATTIPHSIVKLCELYGQAKTFSIGDEIRLQNGIQGRICYIGIPQFKKYYSNQYIPMEIIGIETGKWYVNLGNGRIDGIKYFKANWGHAYFIESVKIWKYYDMSLKETKYHKIWTCDKIRRDYTMKYKISMNNIKQGDRVKYKNGLIGDVVFFGTVQIARNYWNIQSFENTVGLELIDFSPNAMTDGEISGTYYVNIDKKKDCKGKIYFTNIKGIICNYGRCD